MGNDERSRTRRRTRTVDHRQRPCGRGRDGNAPARVPPVLATGTADQHPFGNDDTYLGEDKHAVPHRAHSERIPDHALCDDCPVSGGDGDAACGYRNSCSVQSYAAAYRNPSRFAHNRYAHLRTGHAADGSGKRGA